MQTEFKLKTNKREEIIDITEKIKEIVNKSKAEEGVCLIYVPHATAALTINENYDPKVCEDFLEALRKIAPRGKWTHDKEDGNGDAHIKSAIIGPGVTIPIKNSSLLLGRWQGIMFCEFDGPRDRKIIIQIIESK
ncbi:MAG: secondary thiamine-phosphate synthase enzyme YjbQ [Candidatus Pacearchaeota archaeon]|nr:secondary thiamine-phosphate synthase enzyme YjbQ [Candidatus Pacearchaeota archaeon]